MKTLHYSIILFVLMVFSIGLKQNAYAENETEPVIITQVELGSPLALDLDNQTCTSPPDPKLTNNCRTDLIPGHNVMCSYFLGSSTCEPLHQATSGTNQSCLRDSSTPGAPQWFDMYNISNMTVDLQNFTAFDKLNYGPYGNEGPFSTIIELQPHEKCTFTWPPVDEALSMGLNNMSMSISYNYDGKYYNVSTPSFSDTYNDTRTWQFDGNKWSFAQNGTVMEENMTMSNHLVTLQEPPLKQFESGVNAVDVKCSDGFTLVIKSEDGSPACLKPDTVQILVERGWAEPITGRITQTNDTQNMKNHDPFGITALVIYKPSSGCLSDGCPPNDFYLKINSNSAAYLLGYNICDGDSCTKSNDLSVLLPLNSGLKPDYQMIELPVHLQWRDGDAINIQLEISSTLDNKTGLLVDIGNSIIVPQ